MDAPVISSPQKNNYTSFNSYHSQTPSNVNHDLSHFHNIFPAPPKNSLIRSTRSETHLTDMRNFAHPSEKVILANPYQLHQKVQGFLSNEELMRNTKLPNVSSSSSNLHQIRDKMGCSNENVEKGERPSFYKSFHSLSTLLFRGSGNSNHNIRTSQPISEEGELDIVEPPPPRIRKTSSASNIDTLAREICISNFEKNMLKSKEYSQSNMDKLDDSIVKEGCGLTMTIDKSKSSEIITNALDKSLSSGNIFNRSDLSNNVIGKKGHNEDGTGGSNDTIHKSGGVFGFLGKGIFGKPVSANENETARYILTLEQ